MAAQTPLELQYSVDRQLLELEQGEPLAAAAQRSVVVSQYFPVSHEELDVHASPTCTGPHVPGRLVPPSRPLTTTRFRQLSVEREQYRVLEHG